MFKNKKILYIIVSSIIIVALSVGLILIYRNYLDRQTEKGEKNITVQVVAERLGYEKTYVIKTKSKYLKKPLQDNIKIEVTHYPGYGDFVDVVDEIIPAENEFWYITINGKDGSLGIDVQPIKDGDKIIFVLTEFEGGF